MLKHAQIINYHKLYRLIIYKYVYLFVRDGAQPVPSKLPRLIHELRLRMQLASPTHLEQPTVDAGG